MSKELFGGIDCGKDGAIALINKNGKVIFIEKTPLIPLKKRSEYDIRLMCDWLESFKNDIYHIAIEKQFVMPKQGTVSMFSIGKGYGYWIGLLTALHIPYSIVSPKEWRKEILGELAREKKQGAILRAEQLFPNTDLRATNRCYRLHSGKCDALCIAEYCRRKLFI